MNAKQLKIEEMKAQDSRVTEELIDVMQNEHEWVYEWMWEVKPVSYFLNTFRIWMTSADHRAFQAGLLPDRLGLDRILPRTA